MPVKSILKFGHPTLRQKSTPVMVGDPQLATDIAELADSLQDFRRRTNWGRAIAANQIGIAKRLIVFNLGAGPVVLINPEIIWASGDMVEMWDDCFSLPEILVRVRRPRSISISYLDETFASQTMMHLDPSLSELLHHEIDHLNGVLMVDRSIDPSLTIAREMRSQADAMLT